VADGGEDALESPGRTTAGFLKDDVPYKNVIYNVNILRFISYYIVMP
jgi:hypothetical protein